jgi:5'-nucleotidase
MARCCWWMRATCTRHSASNLTEGASVVDAYQVLGYAAATIATTISSAPRTRSRTTRRAHSRRIASARFAMLSANLIDENPKPRALAGLAPSILVEVAGFRWHHRRVTEETPQIGCRRSAGLDVTPIVPAVRREAALLRDKGAELVVLVAHAGGVCSVGCVARYVELQADSSSPEW